MIEYLDENTVFTREAARAMLEKTDKINGQPIRAKEITEEPGWMKAILTLADGTRAQMLLKVVEE